MNGQIDFWQCPSCGYKLKDFDIIFDFSCPHCGGSIDEFVPNESDTDNYLERIFQEFALYFDVSE